MRLRSAGTCLRKATRPAAARRGRSGDASGSRRDRAGVARAVTDAAQEHRAARRPHCRASRSRRSATSTRSTRPALTPVKRRRSRVERAKTSGVYDGCDLQLERRAVSQKRWTARPAATRSATSSARSARSGRSARCTADPGRKSIVSRGMTRAAQVSIQEAGALPARHRPAHDSEKHRVAPRATRPAGDLAGRRVPGDDGLVHGEGFGNGQADVRVARVERRHLPPVAPGLEPDHRVRLARHPRAHAAVRASTRTGRIGRR